MRRRDFIMLAAGAAAWPLGARAESAVPLIGYLDAAGMPHWLAAFRRGLSDAGYLEGKTIVVEQRVAGGEIARLPALADELVALQPRLIVTSGSPATLAV